MTTESVPRLVRHLGRTLAATDLAAVSDADLLTRFRQTRDPAAFEAIVRRHGPRVLTACRKVLHHDADVDDAFQATFVVLMRGPQAVRRGSSLGQWLFGVAHRVALQARAARRRRDRLEARATAKREQGPDLSWPEACAILHEELDRLPDRVRRPLLLCYLEGKTRDEAATELGRTLASVKKALEKGREALRKRLSRRGVTLSAGLLSAVAAPVAVESADVSSVLVEGISRPSAAVAGLARAVGHTASWARRVGLGLAASALGVGLALGFPGGPKPDPSRPTEATAQVPTAKDPPAKEAPSKPPTEKGPPARPVVKDPPAADQAKPEQIEFTGRVIDPDGRPMKGARVFIAGWSTDYPGKDREPRTLATAGPDGRFEFSIAAKQLDAESAPCLVAAAAGLGGMAVQPLARPFPKEVTLALAKDFAFHGRLVDADNRPVAGARVRVVEVAFPDGNDLAAAVDGLNEAGWSVVWNKPGGAPFARRVRGWDEPLPGFPDRVRTDWAGGFAITGIGAGRLATLLVDGPGLATAEVRVLTQPGESVSVIDSKDGRRTAQGTVRLYRHNFAFEVAKGRFVWGTVTDFDSGRPLAGATVRAAEGRLSARATTDAEGRYRLDGLATGNPELRVEGPPGALFFPLTRYAATSTDKKERDRVDARLTRGEWLTGRVVEARTNKPVAGARVEYHAHAENAGPGSLMESELRPDGRVWRRGSHSEGVSGPDGRFRIVSARGEGWVLVKKPSFMRYFDARQRYIQGEKPDRYPPASFEMKGTAVFTWDYSAIAAVHVDLDRPADLTITLETGVWPEVRYVDPDGKPLTGLITRQDSTFNPDGPRPLITAFHSDRRFGIGYNPPAGDPGPWTVKLQPLTTVTARLVRKNGEPISNDDVYVNPSRTYGAPLSPRDWKFRTDKDGRVRFTDIIVGAEYDLWCAGLAEKIWDKRHRPFVAKPGAVTDLGTIVGGEPRK